MSKKSLSVKASTGMFLLGTVGMGGIALTLFFINYVLKPITQEKRMKKSIQFAESLLQMETEKQRNILDAGSALAERQEQ